MEKPVDEFPRQKRSKDGRFSYCRDCSREYQREARRTNDWETRRRARRYGLTVEQLKELVESQGGVCAVCARPNNQPDKRAYNGQRALHIDHDHKTGKVRGLLCQHCNGALGRVSDDPALLRALAEYIESHR